MDSTTNGQRELPLVREEPRRDEGPHLVEEHRQDQERARDEGDLHVDPERLGRLEERELDGPTGSASQVMICSEKLKVTTKPIPSAMSAHHDPLPKLAQVGEERHAALLGVLGVRAGREGLRNNITPPGSGGRARLARVDDERDLTADARGRQRGPEGARGPSPELLEPLRHLAREHDLGLAEDRLDGREGRREPVRALVEHDRAPEHRELTQPARRRPGFIGQEPLEDEPVGGHPRRRQRGDERGRARDGHDRHARSRQRRTRRKPGSETPGVPASVTSAIRAPRLEPAHELGPAARLVVLEVARRAAPAPRTLEERPRPPRVLGRDQVHLAQDPQRPQRDVLEVTDGGRDDEERARRQRSRRRRAQALVARRRPGAADGRAGPGPLRRSPPSAR